MLRERVAKAQPRELSRSVREDVDADAERAELRRLLEDAARDAFVVQAQREREPGNAAADDEDVFAHCRRAG